ncbi:unnamed protein product [Rhizophagus irregularis]|nr:unnamed protein product [Rhizophagus irregularis]
MFSRGQSCEITITRLTRTGIFGEIEQQKHLIRLRRQSLQSNANFIFYQRQYSFQCGVADKIIVVYK